MPRNQFSDLKSLLEDFADRLERGQQRISYVIDPGSFPTAKSSEAFHQQAAELCAKGILSARYEGRGFQSRISRLSPNDPNRLFTFIGREKAAEVVGPIVTELAGGSEPWESAVLEHIADAWLSKSKWRGMGAGDVAEVRLVQKIARALRSVEADQFDQRTLCSRCVGDSKYLENRWMHVFDYLFHDADQKPERSLRGLLEHFRVAKLGQPVFISGPFALNGMPIGPSVDYLGVAEGNLCLLSFVSQPAYVLSIENRTSFHRYAVETNTAKKGFIIYTGGQPSFNVQQLYRNALSQLPSEVPVFHWSDVDEGGLDIFTTIEELSPRVLPHLMSQDLAIRHGKPTRGKSGALVKGGVKLKPLAEFLAKAETYTLEQEVLDPVPPV